jgi:GNAT superfamily N-acetyltransferase
LGRERALGPAALTELRIFVDAIRARGLRWAARALFRRYVFSLQRVFLCWDPLATPDEAGPPDPAITLRVAGPGDLETLRAFEPHVVRARFREWLERDDTWVVIAFDGDRPVGFRCSTTRLPRDPVLPPLALEPYQVWTPEIYVLPEYRRRHLSMRLRTHLDDILRRRGFSERVSKIDGDNYPQLKRKLTTLAPSARLHHVRCLCVLGLRWRWIDRDGGQALAREVSRLERT